jgi:hypothetical protein
VNGASQNCADFLNFRLNGGYFTLKGAQMSLKNATLLAIIGICYTFVSRTIGTVFPGLFRNLAVAQVSGILHLLAGLTAVLFFVYFLRHYVRENQTELKNGTVLALVGSSLMSLLLLKGVLPLLDRLTFGSLLGPHFIEPVVPWVSSILILLFFTTFHKHTTRKRDGNLERATLWGVVGASIGVLVRTLTVFFYLTSGTVRWVSDFPGTIIAVLFLIFAFGFGATLYFFASFYKQQASQDSSLG